MLRLDEIHRFPNGVNELAGHYYWDLPSLWREVREGLSLARKRYPGLRSVGVDTWGVDHVLMDSGGRPLFPVHAYRDLRTSPFAEALRAKNLPQVYQWTGMPDYSYNTSLQLQESLAAMPGLREQVHACLCLPDYFNFLLSGKMHSEVSIASHSQLLRADSIEWSREALEHFDIPRSWFPPPLLSPARLGPCRLWEETDRQVEVIAVSGHDTASAFLAMPASDDGNDVYLSTGTWSLIGFENDFPITSPEALAAQVSNERMGDGRFRPIKACLGLWLLERLFDDFNRHPETPDQWTALIEVATAAPAPSKLLDVADSRFFNPSSMRREIETAFREAGGSPPRDLPGYVRLICASLAEGHRAAIRTLESLSGKTFQRALLTGGGARNPLLCQLTADACQLPVVALDIEGAAVGNIAAQLIGLEAVPDLATFRHRFGQQLGPKVFQPEKRKSHFSSIV